jgi:hypothetical protein
MVEAGLSRRATEKRIRQVRKMQNFVIAGKAKTVFRLIELKAKQEGNKGGKNTGKH